MFIDTVFEANGGLATREQILRVMSKRSLAFHLKTGAIVRVWRGVYALSPPDLLARLAGLDLITGQRMVACMGTAAELHGFDTEKDERIHVLDPGVRMRPVAGLMVHQRTGAPLTRVQNRLATAPAWTAVEVARRSDDRGSWPSLTQRYGPARALATRSVQPSTSKEAARHRQGTRVDRAC